MSQRKSLQVKGKGVKVSDLLPIFSRLRSALSDRGAIPRANHFVFLKGARVGAYSGTMGIVANLPPGFPRRIEGSTEGKVLYGLLSSLPDSMAIEVVEEEGTLVIKSGKSRFGVSISDRNPDDATDDIVFGNLYSFTAMVDSGKVDQAFPDSFRQALVLCSFYASRDLTRPEECGVLVRKDGEVVAIDSHKGTAIASSGVKKAKDFCARASSVVALENFPDGTLTNYTTASKEGNWTYFSGPEYVVTMGEEGRFEEAESLEREGEKKDGVEIPPALKGTLDRALVLLDDLFVLDREVDLSFSGKTLICSTKQSNKGWFREELPLKNAVKGEIQVRMNPVFLRDALRHSTTMYVSNEGYVVTFVSGDFECTLRTVEGR